MAQASRVFWITYELFRDNPSLIFIFFWFGQGALSLILNFVLSFRLNHLFDPKLKKYTEQYTDWVPSLTDRYLRTGLYANWVAKKEWFGRNRREVQAVDFRKGLSPQTVRLCWLFTINGYSMMIEMMIAAVLLWAGLL